MNCLPQTPVAQRFLDSGWVAFANAIDTTNTLTTGEPVYAEVITIPNVASQSNEMGRIAQIHVEETAGSSANIKKAPLHLLLWTRATAAPTTPTTNTVYNASTANYIGTFAIGAANYDRWSDTVWTAVIKPNHIFKTGGDAVATDFHGVLLSNSGTGVTFAASAAFRVRVICEPAA